MRPNLFTSDLPLTLATSYEEYSRLACPSCHDPINSMAPVTRGVIFPTYETDENTAGSINGIFLTCPGCGESSHMRLYPESHPKPESPSWLITGFPDTITLHPSINCVGCCGWHGWLKNGTFTTNSS